MSPYEIEIMLHYYCMSTDHDDIHGNPPVWRPTIESFLEVEMLTNIAPPGCIRDCAYFITDKGKAYVEHLCAVQVPIAKWVQPEPAKC